MCTLKRQRVSFIAAGCTSHVTSHVQITKLIVTCVQCVWVCTSDLSNSGSSRTFDVLLGSSRPKFEVSIKSLLSPFYVYSNTLVPIMATATSNILVICTGNTCRSPMAAMLLQNALQAQPEPLRSIKVTSAGLSATGGPVSEFSVLSMEKAGLDISSYTSKLVTNEIINEADLILCMTESHRRAIIQLCRNPKKVFLFREFIASRKDKLGCDSRDIDDPYGMPSDVYDAVRDDMIVAIPSLVEFIKTWFVVA